MQLKYIFFTIILLSVCSNANLIADDGKVLQPISFFNNKAHDNFYWEALVTVIKDKQKALNVINALRSSNSQTHDETFAWNEEHPANIDDFFDKLFIDYVSVRPQALTQIGLFDPIGVRDHNAHLNDVSPQAVLAGFNQTKRNMAILNKYSYDELSDEQKISYKIFSWMLQHQVAGESFVFHEYRISQLQGILADLSVLLTQFHKLEVMEDVRNYITRLSKIPTQIDQAIELMEWQKAHGIIPPRFTVQKVIVIIERTNPIQKDEHVFYKHLTENVEKIGLENKQTILDQAADIINNQVYPAYEKLKKYFVQLLDVAQENNGVWALPDGDAYYRHMLKQQTTTDFTPEQIHQLGLEEVKKIHDQMRSLLAQEGIADDAKSVGALMQELAKDQRFYYPNTAEGRELCLKNYEAILERVRKELMHLFDLKPQTGVAIKRVPIHEEASAPGAFYFQPSLDGSRPGIFFANLRDMSELPTYGMETLTVHEAEPGHHFQLGLQNEMEMPIFRKITEDFNAYAEGWALYTEKLAYEHNFYSSSFTKLGHLQDELMRAARLVLDTGIHHKRWTREQAIAYMKEVTGYNHNSVVTEIERYFVLPGQACSYKIGQLKILELRKRAQESLGDAFNIKEFHNAVLRVGMVPLSVLEEVINQYIQDNL